MTTSKKIIEVALPLEAISSACRADKNRKTGTIRNIHKWFAPMPSPAWRALLFASIVDWPANPDDAENLLKLISDLVPEDGRPPSKDVLLRAQRIIHQAGEPPIVLDPFCGGGSTLIEAARLGLHSVGSDLNPVPVVIARMLARYAPLVANVGPFIAEDKSALFSESGPFSGFLSDVHHYAELIRQEVAAQFEVLYPDHNDSKPIAYIWCRSIRCPNPACQAWMPLVTSYWLATKKGAEVRVTPVPSGPRGLPSFAIEYGMPVNDSNPAVGTQTVNAEGKPQRASFTCVTCRVGIANGEYIDRKFDKREGRVLPMVGVFEGKGYRQYEALDHIQLTAIEKAEQLLDDEPWRDLVPREPARGTFGSNALGRRYGFEQMQDYYLPRQLLSLMGFARSVAQVREHAQGRGAPTDYADALTTFLSLCVGRLSQASSTLVRWRWDSRNGSSKAELMFGRNDVPMTWDFAETAVFGGSVGDWMQTVETAARALPLTVWNSYPAKVLQRSADGTFDEVAAGSALLATDPPYFDNIAYADLSDFFYIWLRRAMKDVDPQLFSSLLTPKGQELTASPLKYGTDKVKARKEFEEGFQRAFESLRGALNSSLPVVIVYAFKQQELSAEGFTSSGWEAMLQAILAAGYSVVGTWPIHGTGSTRQVGLDRNALASYIALVCRARSRDAALTTRRGLVAEMRTSLPDAVKSLQSVNIAPVDLAQATIGPGMGVFSKYSKVVEADGSTMSIRAALGLINQVLDEVLAEQESDFDSDTRWALAWFEQQGMAAGPFGLAETLSRAKNTAMNGLVQSGIAGTRAGKVWLVDRSELPRGWDPAQDERLTVWEVTQHLVKALEAGGEEVAASLLHRVGYLGEVARELAYRLYTICERKKWVKEALAYNGLIVSWPAIASAARQRATMTHVQQELL
jgi:putative DNA methylase